MVKIKIINDLMGDRSSWSSHVGAVYEVAEFRDLKSVITTCGRRFYQGEYEIIEGDLN